MPWIGVRSALRAARSCKKDCRLLIGLALRARMYEDVDLAGEEATWEQAVDEALYGIAGVILEACKQPEFCDLPVHMIQKLVAYVEHGEWSDKVRAHVPASPEVVHRDYSRAHTNQGVHFAVFKADDFVCTSASLDPKEGADLLQLDCNTIAIVHVDAYIQAPMARIRVSLREEVIPSQPAPLQEKECADSETKDHKEAGFAPSLLSMYRREKLSAFEGGEPPRLTFVFRTRISKLHKRCVALVRYYAGTHCIDMKEASFVDVWRYFRRLGCVDLSNTLKTCVSMNFKLLYARRSKLFQTLDHIEMEEIVSDSKFNALGEVDILGELIDWAMHRSKQPKGVQVGDQVRVGPGCQDESWREADCQVIEAHCSRVLLQRVREDDANNVETLQVDAKMVYDVGQTGFMRMLKHIRFGCIGLEYFNDYITMEQLAYALKIPCFQDIVHRMIDVQTGRCSIEVLGEQGKPRNIRNAEDCFPPVDSSNESFRSMLADIIKNAAEGIGIVGQEGEEKAEEIHPLIAGNEHQSREMEQLLAKDARRRGEQHGQRVDSPERGVPQAESKSTEASSGTADQDASSYQAGCNKKEPKLVGEHMGSEHSSQVDGAGESGVYGRSDGGGEAVRAAEVGHEGRRSKRLSQGVGEGGMRKERRRN